MVILEQLLSSHKAVQKCQIICVDFCLDFSCSKNPAESHFCLQWETMEGKETSPSHTSESSILDLPSVCDLAEHFLPPHSSENSEEPYPSGDVFPSPPTGNSFCFSTCSFFSQCFICVGSVLLDWVTAVWYWCTCLSYNTVLPELQSAPAGWMGHRREAQRMLSAANVLHI